MEFSWRPFYQLTCESCGGILGYFPDRETLDLVKDEHKDGCPAIPVPEKITLEEARRRWNESNERLK